VAGDGTFEEIEVSYLKVETREKQAIDMKAADKLKAEKEPSFETISFDLQAVLTTPHAGDAQIYYKRKLSVYNFTIYKPSTKDGYCYVWDETEGGRGSCEIGTCLLEFVQGLPKHVTHLSTFSDTCGGQNRNQFIVAALLQTVQRSDVGLNIIDLKYMERGHSFLEVDSMHACIEREKKHRQVYTTGGWQLLISMARKEGKPYIVRAMDHGDFCDLKSLAGTMVKNKTKNSGGEAVSWLRLKWLRFERSMPNQIKYKYSLSEDEEFKVLDCSGNWQPMSDVTNAADVLAKLKLAKLYSDRLPISAAKKKDLMKLVDDKVIPSDYRSFYENLPTSSSAADFLPMRDIQDPDTDEESTDGLLQSNIQILANMSTNMQSSNGKMFASTWHIFKSAELTLLLNCFYLYYPLSFNWHQFSVDFGAVYLYGPVSGGVSYLHCFILDLFLSKCHAWCSAPL